MNTLQVAIETKNVAVFKQYVYSPFVFYTPKFVVSIFKFAVNQKCIEELVYLSEQIDISIELRKQLMDIACRTDNVECLDILGKSRTYLCNVFQPILITAVCSNSLHCIQWILDNVKEVNFIDVIQIACEQKYIEIVKILVSKLNDKLKPNIYMISVSIGKSGSIEIYNILKSFLLKYDINIILSTATDNKQIELIRYILVTENIQDFRYMSNIFGKYTESVIFDFVKDLWHFESYRIQFMKQSCTHEYRTIINYILEQSDFTFDESLYDIKAIKTIYVVRRLLQDYRISALKLAELFINIINIENESYQIMDELMSIPEVFWTYATPIQRQHWYIWQKRTKYQLRSEICMSDLVLHHSD